MTVLEVKPHKVYIRDLVPYRTAVMFSWLLFLLFYKKIPTLSAGKLECGVVNKQRPAIQQDLLRTLIISL